MIFSHSPSNWKELQSAVCDGFTECGYNAESPKTITTARSQAVEIDVYVEDNSTPKQIIICECKFWDANIPQAIVHAFRTQISDIGANTGLLIAKKGFQPGAISSARYTNIKLLTWNEFESLYESTWYEKYFFPQVNQICGAFLITQNLLTLEFLRRQINYLTKGKFALSNYEKNVQPCLTFVILYFYIAIWDLHLK